MGALGAELELGDMAWMASGPTPGGSHELQVVEFKVRTCMYIPCEFVTPEPSSSSSWQPRDDEDDVKVDNDG